jgi:gliding motility-associated-like protein
MNLKFVSQVNNNSQHIPGTDCNNCVWSVPPIPVNQPSSGKPNSNLNLYNGNNTIATSYTQTACGLNFTQASHPLYKRGFSFALGVTQPAVYTIAGIPPCATILKAFLYVGTSGGGVAINANLTNPVASSSVFPMAMIGQSPDKCWGYTGTYTYRADVTALISGNGNYLVSGVPVSPAADDADGATLFIIYSDPTQNYTGSIVIADGSIEGSAAASANITGFNVCGPTSLTTNFMIVADLQQIANTPINFNSLTSNFTKTMASDQVWDYITAPGTAATSGQTNANYGLTTSGDCYNFLMAGMYYRTACLVCPVASSGLTVTATSTPSCPTSNATVTAVGGPAPFTYTWTPSAQSTSVATGLSAGIYTVTVKDATGCKLGTATVNVVTAPLSPITINSGTICQTFSVNLNASGASTYTWSPAIGLSTTNGPNVVASPPATQIYSVSFTNTLGCVGTQTTQVIVNPTPTITTSNVTVCAGSSINLTANSLAGSTYSWSGPGGFTSTSQNPVIATSTTLMTGPYTVTVTTTAGCKNTAISNVTVFAMPVPVIGSNAPICANNNLNLTGSGGITYSWVGPNGFSSTLQNPTITSASTLATGVYTLTASSNGCSSSTSSLLTINPLPTPTLTSNTPVCNGLALNLSGSGGNTYSWAGPSAFTSTLQNPVINPASPSNSGNYTLTAITINGCTATVSSSITINPTPTISITGATVCLNTTINLASSSLAGSSYSWSGPNGFTSNLQNPTITNATLIMSGVYNLTVTSAVGCVNTTSTNVSVLSLPAPAITSNAPVCFGSILTLTAGGGVTYQWNGPNGFTSALTNPTINNITLAASGNYSLIAFVGTCSASISQSITVNPLPLPTASNNGPICNGLTLNLGSTGAITYTWTGPSTFSSTAQNPAINPAAPANSGIYTVTVTDLNGCKNFTTTTVLVNPTPTLSTVGSSVCVGQAMSVGANSFAGATYSWSGPNGFSAVGQNTIITNAQTTMSGVYNLTVTSSLGCKNTGFANVSITPLPVPVITNNSPLCAGATLNFNATGGSTYIWSGPNAFTNNSSNPTIPNVGLTSNGTYSIIVSANSCSILATTVVTVNPLPTPAASNSGPICENGTLNLIGSGGVNYSWTGPLGFTSAVQSPSILNVHSNNSGVYILSVLNANGCQASTSTTVVINPLPTLLANGATVCFGYPATLTATGGVTYLWVGPNGFTSNLQNPTLPIVNNATTGNYTVTISGVNTCTSASAVNVGTYPLPVPTITSTGRACVNTPISLQGNTGFLMYQWTGPNNFLSPNSAISFTPLTTTETGMYTLSVTDNRGCTGSTSTLVIVDPLPNATILIDKNKNCIPFCTNFSLQNGAGTASLVSSNWSFNAQTFNSSTFNYCISTAGDYLINASYTDANGCPGSSSYTLNAYPIPTAMFEYSPEKPLEIEDEVKFTDESQGPGINNWYWHFISNFGYQSTSQNPVYTFEKAGIYPIALVVTNKWGCSDTTVKSITIGEGNSFYVPNAFTPNGDGINDTFFAKGYNVSKYEMTIFDRWGEKLFHTNELAGEWDGTFKGQECKNDVYVWKISVIMPDSKTKVYTGHVTINR